MLRRTLLIAAAALLVAVAFLGWLYSRDMQRAYERVHSAGRIVASPYGDVEYTQGGSGPDVLVIHGSGGGYDQGELVAETVLGDGFHWIAPSRFGYLRSTFHDGATWDEQAHAYAHLLDHLGIERVAVVALSHGGPSALVFAVLYPDRVSSLTLLSCGVAPSASAEQARANRKGATLTSVFRFDLPYWAVSTLFERRLMQLIGADDAVITALDARQRALIERLIDYMNPASLRAAGVAFDNETPLPGERIAAITAPALIFHARDDTLQLYHNAEFADAAIPDSTLVSFERGGHIVMAVERSAIRAAAREHILEHASASRP